jgi:hypothetical protein
LADVKSGELLENLYKFIYHNVTGNSKRDGLKNINLRQSASKHLSGNGDEGSETTVSLKYLYHGDDPTAPDTLKSVDDIVHLM